MCKFKQKVLDIKSCVKPTEVTIETDCRTVVKLFQWAVQKFQQINQSKIELKYYIKQGLFELLFFYLRPLKCHNI